MVEELPSEVVQLLAFNFCVSGRIGDGHIMPASDAMLAAYPT